jgi:hypothetical protein
MVSHFASNLQLHAIVSGPLLEKILRDFAVDFDSFFIILHSLEHSNTFFVYK